MEGIITPKYVWITAGVGSWTNKKAAEELAKREAGVDKFKIVKVSTMVDTPFVPITKEQFYHRLGGAKRAYMVGDIHHVQPDQGAVGDISALSSGEWGGVSWCVSYDRPIMNTRSLLPVSKRELICEFEHLVSGEAPDPLTIEVSIDKHREKPYGCIVLAAMVIGDLGYNEQPH